MPFKQHTRRRCFHMPDNISIPSRNVTNMISYRVKNHQTQVKGCAGSLCTQASRLERRPFKWWDTTSNMNPAAISKLQNQTFRAFSKTSARPLNTRVGGAYRSKGGRWDAPQASTLFRLWSTGFGLLPPRERGCPDCPAPQTGICE